MSESEHLRRAYALKTPSDSVGLYRDWADSYDETFAAAHGYVAPREVAAAFRAEAGPDDRPVLDIGAGTGLVGAELARVMPALPVDAIDISREMLDVAGTKGLYRHRIVADLTGPLEIADGAYGGVVSAGTFTHGHVGPGCLPELMRIARPGALFVLGIKAGAFDEAGFGSAFAALVADDAITPVGFRRLQVYEGAGHDHADDTYLTAVFRRR